MSAPKVVRRRADIVWPAAPGEAVIDFGADVVILPVADFDRMVELVETLSGQPCWCAPNDDGHVCGVCRARAFLTGETKGESDGK